MLKVASAQEFSGKFFYVGKAGKKGLLFFLLLPE
jgi:hypothetical protein